MTYLTNSGRFNTSSVPRFIASAASTFSSGNALTCTVPSGKTDGDIMIAAFTSDAGGGPTVTLTGWTLIQDSAGSTPSARLVTWYRIASSEPATYQVTISGGAVAMVFGIAIFRPGNATQPDTSSQQINTASSANVDAATITPTVGSAVVFVGCSNNESVTFTPPSGYTEIITPAVIADATLTVCCVEDWGGGATGTITATQSLSAESMAHLIAIKP